MRASRNPGQTTVYPTCKFSMHVLHMCTCSISSGGGSTCVLFRRLRCQWLLCLSQAVWVPSSFLFFSLIWFCLFTLIKSTLSCNTPRCLSSMAEARWPDLLPLIWPLTSRQEHAINCCKRFFQPHTCTRIHMHTITSFFLCLFAPVKQ